MKASSNSNIFTTGLFAVSMVVIFSSCTKESVEPVATKSTSTSSERKLVIHESAFSNPNSNEFASPVEGETVKGEEVLQINPVTDNLSRINPQSSGGNIENGAPALNDPFRIETNVNRNESLSRINRKSNGNNGEQFIKKEDRISKNLETSAY